MGTLRGYRGQKYKHRHATHRACTLDDMTVEDVAAHLGVARQTLFNWRKRRVGPPYYRVRGRFIRYILAEVEAWREQSVADGWQRAGGECDS